MPNRSSSAVRVFYRQRSREELVRQLQAGVAALAARLPLREVVLFGSCATSRNTVASDVDLLVVYVGTPRPDAFRIVKESIPVARLEPHVYAEEEAERLRPVLTRMAKGGIWLYPAAAPQVVP